MHCCLSSQGSSKSLPHIWQGCFCFVRAPLLGSRDLLKEKGRQRELIGWNLINFTQLHLEILHQIRKKLRLICAIFILFYTKLDNFHKNPGGNQFGLFFALLICVYPDIQHSERGDIGVHCFDNVAGRLQNYAVMWTPPAIWFRGGLQAVTASTGLPSSAKLRLSQSHVTARLSDRLAYVV